MSLEAHLNHYNKEYAHIWLATFTRQFIYRLHKIINDLPPETNKNIYGALKKQAQNLCDLAGSILAELSPIWDDYISSSIIRNDLRYAKTQESLNSAFKVLYTITNGLTEIHRGQILYDKNSSISPIPEYLSNEWYEEISICFVDYMRRIYAWGLSYTERLWIRIALQSSSITSLQNKIINFGQIIYRYTPWNNLLTKLKSDTKNINTTNNTILIPNILQLTEEQIPETINESGIVIKFSVMQSSSCTSAYMINHNGDNPQIEIVVSRLLSLFKVPFFLKYYSSTVDLPRTFNSNDKTTIVMSTEYADCGDLYAILEKPDSPYRDQAFIIFRHIVYGLDFLHNYLGIAHLDLKPENIFIKKLSVPSINGKLTKLIPRGLIGDFGAACVCKIIPDSKKTISAQNTCSLNRIHLKRLLNVNTLLYEMLYHYSILPFSSIEIADTIVNKQEILDITSGLLSNTIPYSTICEKVNDNNSIEDKKIDNDDIIILSTTKESNKDIQPEISDDTSTPSPYKNEKRDHIEKSLDIPSLHLDCIINAYNKKYGINKSNNLGSITCEKKYINFDNIPDYAFWTSYPPASDLFSWKMVKKTYGTQNYMAPELANPPYNPFKADVWSLGVILFIIAYGFPPYTVNDSSGACALNLLHHHGVRELINTHGKFDKKHEKFYELLDGMLKENPKERWSIRQVLEFFVYNTFTFPPYVSKNNTSLPIFISEFC